MKAMVLERAGSPLKYIEVKRPEPGPGQLLIKVEACGVCRTDLHVIDGELTHPKLPLIPGHEIVGQVVAVGDGTNRFKKGDVVGIPWLARTCGRCKYCTSGRENLCEDALFTGYTVDGGYAEYMVSYEAYTFKLPPGYAPERAAPLLCAGLIGHRSLSMAGNANRIGLYGFGAAAHIITQVCKFQDKKVYAFTREGDVEKQKFARELGAVWAGDANRLPPVELDAAIIFAPVGSLVISGLKAVSKGGKVICAGIYMSDIPSFPYDILWWERQIRSVANLTRRDGEEFMKLASKFPIKTQITIIALRDANTPLSMLRNGLLKGAAVLIP